ncbi:carbohydrate sulfotransferase 6-like isoform X2 [Hyla sarda]|nr:carbohydrate sulfotransferase 6-like isoform X2 [Hyla sarda]
MSIRTLFHFCILLFFIFLSYQIYQITQVSRSSKSYDTEKMPVHVLILSSWRSGSSFMGQIFNHHPDVFYLFEPGHPVWKRFGSLGVGANLLHYPVRDLIRSLFTCDVTPLQQYVFGNGCYISSMSFFAESRALCSPPSCSRPMLPEGYNRTICYQYCRNSTFENMAKTCDTYNHRVMKTVRILDFSVLRPLFWDPALDLRIIHLVRDPRAIASSRRYFSLSADDKVVLKEHDKTINAPVLAKICKAQANINRMAKAEGHHLDGRYMLLRHEDLSREPIVNVRKIFQFSGLKMTTNFESWIYNITHIDESDRIFIPFSKQSSKVIQKWRKTMDFNKVKEIEEYCKEAMDLFGYLPVSSEGDQKNMNIDFVL